MTASTTWFQWTLQRLATQTACPVSRGIMHTSTASPPSSFHTAEEMGKLEHGSQANGWQEVTRWQQSCFSSCECTFHHGSHGITQFSHSLSAAFGLALPWWKRKRVGPWLVKQLPRGAQMARWQHQVRDAPRSLERSRQRHLLAYRSPWFCP